MRVIGSDNELCRTMIDDIVKVYATQVDDYAGAIFKRKMNTTLESIYKKQVSDLPSASDMLNDTQSMDIADFTSGNGKRFTPVKRAIAFKASTEWLESNQWGGAQWVAQQLALSHDLAFQQSGANVLNSATSITANALGPDGKPLVDSTTFNGGHPTDAGTYHNNRGYKKPDGTYADIALGYQAVAYANQTLLDQLGKAGNIYPCAGRKTLVVPTALDTAANHLIDTPNGQIPGSNDNTRNYAGKQVSSVVCNPFLTSATAWFLVSEDANQNGLFWIESRKFTLKYDEDIIADATVWASTKKFLHSFDKATGVWGTAGA